jgi:hypothetical protein
VAFVCHLEVLALSVYALNYLIRFTRLLQVRLRAGSLA